ncbi:L,D-transpeptidase [Nocardiopsis trehalosi]|jgi:lipoprotein-anchoring transpeptidase ErfK/SrfK|uniref:L,D-transpeptidase n=1 Tax=Nocardiopsis trehalosi TaxID=109329 RepID=UPI000836FF2E|nr:L,D-transpeptidase [Nocardiopsis trehalosi]
MYRLPFAARDARTGARRLLPPLAAAAALAALTACQSAPAGAPDDGGGAGGDASAEAPADGAAPAEIATAVGDEIEIYAEEGGEEVEETLASPNDFGADRAFLVQQNAGDWLEVLLPVRPNGSTGWVKAEDVELSATTFRLEVDPEAFTFTVFDGGEEVRSGQIGTGESETPTPPGRYYFTELLQPSDPDGDYGAYAFGLSGHSETLETFAGGPGQLAVHGTNDPDALGQQISHGCIRVSNDDITWMAENLPVGTPVEILG